MKGKEKMIIEIGLFICVETKDEPFLLELIRHVYICQFFLRLVDQ